MARHGQVSWFWLALYRRAAALYPRSLKSGRRPFSSGGVMLKTSQDPHAMTTELEDALWDVDPHHPVRAIEVWEDTLDDFQDVRPCERDDCERCNDYEPGHVAGEPSAHEDLAEHQERRRAVDGTLQHSVRVHDRLRVPGSGIENLG